MPADTAVIDTAVLEKMFHPKTIAIVGVSPNGFGFGIGILGAMLGIGFSGRIYPVNPKGGEVSGMKLLTSLDEIHEPIDFAIVAVPAESVPEALEMCRKKGAAGAEIVSAGFSETGTAEGAALEKKIKDIARRDFRIVGPNCFGIYCPESGLTFLPGVELSRESGPVGFLSQSGGMSVDFAQMGRWMGIRFSKVVSFGNGADLREVSLLRYFKGDARTTIITMYIEGVRDGREFFNALQEAAESKPVIVYKGGLSDAGGRAVLSHTASMGGSAVIWRSLLQQSNAVQVGSLPEMAQAALAFSMLPGRVYRGVSVIGGGGALGVNACDAAEKFGLVIPPLADDLQQKIMAILPKPGSSAVNPIDVNNPLVPPHILKESLRFAAMDPAIDVQILFQLLYHFRSLALGIGVKSMKDITPHRDLADAVGEVMRETGKPVILVLPSRIRDIKSMDVEEVLRETRELFLERGIPVFDELSDALRALRHVSHYNATRQRRLRET
ncbi:MAG: CoA-binding protein [Deltaproteobacteria bacterium]|nr:CoA-binding protein [Deltaproteobacteria bacterium]